MSRLNKESAFFLYDRISAEVWDQREHSLAVELIDRSAESERDPNFQGYGVARTDGNGAFHFRTIRPVAYPGRTPHIHVRVQAPGAATLATQLYLPDDPGNRRDFLFSRLSAEEQAAVSLKLEPTQSAGASHALARATQFVARADLVIA